MPPPRLGCKGCHGFHCTHSQSLWNPCGEASGHAMKSVYGGTYMVRSPPLRPIGSRVSASPRKQILQPVKPSDVYSPVYVLIETS